jgi:ATP-binding cassette subfamily B (MDR/TAP) protein 10
VRAFAQESKESSLYSSAINKVMAMKYKEATANGLFFSVNGFAGNFIILSVFYFGGGSIAENLITIGDLSSFLLYSAYVGIAISGLSSFYSELMKGIGASSRIWEIIDRHPTIPIISESNLNVFENLNSQHKNQNDI